MLIRRGLALLIDVLVCSSLFVVVAIISEIKMQQQWKVFNAKYQLLEEQLLNELGITEKYWQEMFIMDGKVLDMMNPKFPDDLFLEYVQGEKIKNVRSIIRYSIRSLWIIFLPFIYALHVWLFKRSLGQRLLRLEFYNHDNIKFWRNIFLRAICIGWLYFPLMILTFINSVSNKKSLKNNILLDEITNMYIRKI